MVDYTTAHSAEGNDGKTWSAGASHRLAHRGTDSPWFQVRGGKYSAIEGCGPRARTNEAHAMMQYAAKPLLRWS